MIETDRLVLIDANEADIEAIMEMENHEDNRNFIWQGTYHEHKKEIESSDCMLFIVKEKHTGSTVGFTLNFMDNKSNRFELRRFAVTKKGVGYGREVLTSLIKFAFEELKMNRFWLDVFQDNKKGIRLYESIGMHKDGVLRQNYKTERGYLDMTVYSILKSEYFKS